MSVCFWDNFYRAGRNLPSPRMELFVLGGDLEFLVMKFTSGGGRYDWVPPPSELYRHGIHQQDFSVVFHAMERSWGLSSSCFHGDQSFSAGQKGEESRGEGKAFCYDRLWRMVSVLFQPWFKGTDLQLIMLKMARKPRVSVIEGVSWTGGSPQRRWRADLLWHHSVSPLQGLDCDLGDAAAKCRPTSVWLSTEKSQCCDVIVA